jgi:serpin B
MCRQSIAVVALLIAGTVAGRANAEVVTVGDDLRMSIPCVAYQGLPYSLTLQPYLHPSDPGGLYWRLSGCTTGTRTGGCVELNDDLGLLIPCAAYKGSQFALVLEWCENHQGAPGLYWELETGFAVAASTGARETSPVADPDDLSETVAGLGSFTFDLYQAIRGTEGNLFYSPLSVSMALAMTYAGARGETARQMQDTLHFTLGQQELHPAYNALDQELASREELPYPDEGDGFRLRIANALWGQVGFSFQTEFLDLLATNYGAGLRLLDFSSAPEDSRLVINDWVERQTVGRVEDLLPFGSITRLTRLVLTNAIYFKAAWSVPFDEEYTADGGFTLLDGTAVTVPLMHQSQTLLYAAGSGYEAVELPYQGAQVSMLIVVPQGGEFDSFEADLTAGSIEPILGELDARVVTLAMPRFTFTATLDLKQELSALGMASAFGPQADFTGMHAAGELMITDVFHKAFVAVDEAGTEAAAATAVVVGETAVPEQVSLTINRPFIFLIRDIPTGAILFVGRVLDPTG